MATYLFVVTDGGKDGDPIMVDLPDVKSAWAQAVTFCGEILEELDGNFGLSQELLITVFEADRRLFELRCSSQHF